jgi:hypothetical protein
MPLSWNEIRNRSMAFSKKWEGEASEHAEAKSFWDEFFNVFGITRKRVASFEEPVKKLGDKQGFIDLFWKGVLLVEHKSRGKDLNKAYTQALDYFPGIAERDLPKYVLVSDFDKFRLYDLEENTQHDFELKDLHKNVQAFGFIAGYQTHKIKEQDPVNITAAEQMGRLHDQMKAVGYDGHALEHYLVRLLFCLFAEDTGIFERRQFQDYIEQKTHEDGSDLAHHMATLFHVLNQESEKRLKNLDEQLAAFPYVNGRLFAEPLPPASFDSAMRQALLDCCGLDWSRISPAIFGSLFQSIMDKKARRNLGAHYTSEKNILKLIKPLFLDELWQEFESVKSNKQKLFAFHGKLRKLKFLDPACGCGNFLVIVYRELRLLELEILRVRFKANEKSGQTENIQTMILLDVDQFYGIEIEEFPAQIAQVALWLMDHQINLKISEEFGEYFARIPLRSSGSIVCGNSLRLNWNEVVPAKELSYILGNPPFIGAKFMDDAQRSDVAEVFDDIKNAGLLDFVAAWYVKAAKMMQGTSIRCAFVSTNSIVQGEQVGVLWSWMLANSVKIFFAHRTFSWNNEARGKAAVHCVIVGFAMNDISPKLLFEYEDIKGEAHRAQVKNINPYLVDAPNIVLFNRSKPLCDVPEIGIGNKPIDGGYYLFLDDEMAEFIKQNPVSKFWFKKWLGADEFINGWQRWCLFIRDIPPNEIKSNPAILEIVDKVRDYRLGIISAKRASADKEPKVGQSAKQLAATPTRFHVEKVSTTTQLIIPSVSSERRNYIPIGFEPETTLCSNLVFVAVNSNLFHFGILNSIMHNAWTRTVCGRLKSDYRYSVGIVYNNFPWPENLNAKHKQAIEEAAQAVLDARAQFPDSTLADLYDPLTMPPVLLKVHQALDKAVDAAYGKTNFKTEAERVAFLFIQYEKLIPQLIVNKV